MHELKYQVGDHIIIRKTIVLDSCDIDKNDLIIFPKVNQFKVDIKMVPIMIIIKMHHVNTYHKNEFFIHVHFSSPLLPIVTDIN